MNNQFRKKACFNYPAMGRDHMMTDTGTVLNRMYLKNSDQGYFSDKAKTTLRPALQAILDWDKKVFSKVCMPEIIMISRFV